VEAATAAKLRGEPFAECSWREGGRQHEDARRARASLDAHRRHLVSFTDGHHLVATLIGPHICVSSDDVLEVGQVLEG